MRPPPALKSRARINSRSATEEAEADQAIFVKLITWSSIDRSVARIREAFRRAGNTRNTIKVFPGADHTTALTPTTATGEKGSDGANEGPNFAPGYLDTMMA